MSSEPYNPEAPAKVRLEQTRALFTLPNVQKMPQLLWIANNDPDDDIRARAIEGIGMSDAPEAFDALVAAFDDPSWHVRYGAAFYLGKRGDPGAVAALLRALWTEDDKPDTDDREFSRAPKRMAEALAAIGGTEAVEGLILILLSKRPTRFNAAHALNTLADPRAFDALCMALTLPRVSEWDYVEIVAALVALHDPHAIVILEPFANIIGDPKDYAFQRAQQLAREGVAALRQKLAAQP